MNNDNNYKPWYEKVNIGFAIIASICTILTFILMFFLHKNTSAVDRDPTNNEVKKEHSFNIDGNNNIIIQGDNNGNINLDKEASSDSILPQSNVAHESEKTPQFNFGKAIRHIHKNEIKINTEIINNKDNKPTYSSIYPGISYSQISNKVRLIEVTRGFRDFNCSRLYHFDENGKLTFALIEDNKGEHRLYFYDDMLIRYIDIDGKSHDINYGLENIECKWRELALEEGYEIFNGI